MDCKKSISWQLTEGGVAFGVFDSHLVEQSQIITWGMAGKGDKIFIEMRLVVKVRLACKLCPIDGLRGINRAQDMFKPVKTG